MSKESKGEWINDAFEICKNDKTGDLYIKVKKDFSAKAGNFLNIEKRETMLKKLHEKGFISEEQLKQRLSQAQWVKYVGTVPPQKDMSKDNE